DRDLVEVGVPLDAAFDGGQRTGRDLLRRQLRRIAHLDVLARRDQRKRRGRGRIAVVARVVIAGRGGRSGDRDRRFGGDGVQRDGDLRGTAGGDRGDVERQRRRRDARGGRIRAGEGCDGGVGQV